MKPDLGIRAMFRLLLGVAVAGLTGFAVVAFRTIDEVRSGAAEFAHNRVAVEVARDFASPSQALLTFQPLLLEGQGAPGPEDAKRLADILRLARERLEAGHKHYLEVLSPGRLRDLVTVDAYETAEAWFRVAEEEYIPAIERGDPDRASRIRRDEMDPLFQRNRAADEEIGRLADDWRAANRMQVAATVRRRTWQLVAVGAATLIAQLLLGLVIDARVGSTTRQLEATLEELRRKSAEVEAFVYIVSHDLRAPLVNLQGFAREMETSCAALKRTVGSVSLPQDVQASLDQILDSDMHGALHFITAASSRFERLIECLLQLSRQSQEAYELREIDTQGLVQAKLAGLREEIDRSGASIVLGDLPGLDGDSTALGLVIENLLANSIKYRDPGRSLVVSVGGHRRKGAAEVWVRDNGVGIPAGGLSRLFKVFQRLRPDLAGGEGMGLAIAHRIVERHGGRMWAESQEGQGTTFFFSLPLKANLPSMTSEEARGHERK
jgi:signal transduction histidine kinase